MPGEARQYWFYGRPTNIGDNLMAAAPQGLCISSSPSGRSPRRGEEQRCVCLGKGYATTSGCRLPEEVRSHEMKGVAINRDASYRNA
jgi:hypothetical protein